MPNTTLVTTGKPKIGGAIYTAPLGTTLPTDATSALGDKFMEMGYASEDGVTNSNSPDSDSVKEWGGATVLTPQTSKEDNFNVTLLEALNLNVLKAVYGDGNVSGTLATGITIKANADELEARVWVFEMILSGGVKKRIVVPVGTVSEVGDITYTAGDPVGFELTVNASPDANGNTHYEYIASSASEEG